MKKLLKTLLALGIAFLALAGAAMGALTVLVMTDVFTSFDPEKLGNY